MDPTQYVYFAPSNMGDQIEENRRNVRVKNVYNVLFRKYEGKRQLGRPRQRWKDDDDEEKELFLKK
jgi:hypothetical protein